MVMHVTTLVIDIGCSNNPPVKLVNTASEQCAVISTWTCKLRLGFWSGACSKTGMDKVSLIDGLV